MPLLGGKFSSVALMHYGSWITLAIASRHIAQHSKAGLRLRTVDYSLIGFAGIVNSFIWFRYPISIFIAGLIVIVTYISYRFQSSSEGET